MYHSIRFGKDLDHMIDAWEDWHIVSSKRPVINPPELKTQTIEIPGANGSIDVSEVLTRYPLYNNRTGSFEMYVVNGYGDWVDRYQEISNYLNGERIKMILEDDPMYYYEGRIKVNEWQSNPNWSTIVLNYTLSPFKREIYETDYFINSGTEELDADIIGVEPVVPIISGSGNVRFKSEALGQDSVAKVESTGAKYSSLYFAGKPVLVTVNNPTTFKFTKGML